VVDRQLAAMEGPVAGLVSVAEAPSLVAVVTGPGPVASPVERAASRLDRSSSLEVRWTSLSLLRLVNGGRKLSMPFGEFQELRPELIGCCVLRQCS
jgi:hypothetical protein